MSEKNTKKLAIKYGLPIEKVMVRGGTDHRKDLCLNDGTIVNLWPDGTIIKTDERWK